VPDLNVAWCLSAAPQGQQQNEREKEDLQMAAVEVRVTIPDGLWSGRWVDDDVDDDDDDGQSIVSCFCWLDVSLFAPC
jgi:hypothetical protein